MHFNVAFLQEYPVKIGLILYEVTRYRFTRLKLLYTFIRYIKSNFRTVSAVLCYRGFDSEMKLIDWSGRIKLKPAGAPAMTSSAAQLKSDHRELR